VHALDPVELDVARRAGAGDPGLRPGRIQPGERLGHQADDVVESHDAHVEVRHERDRAPAAPPVAVQDDDTGVGDGQRTSGDDGIDRIEVAGSQAGRVRDDVDIGEGQQRVDDRGRRDDPAGAVPVEDRHHRHAHLVLARAAPDDLGLVVEQSIHKQLSALLRIPLGRLSIRPGRGNGRGSGRQRLAEPAKDRGPRTGFGQRLAHGFRSSRCAHHCRKVWAGNAGTSRERVHRLCAEDPSAAWQPQAGRLGRFEVPGVGASFGLLDNGIRLDAGVESGSVIGTQYDAMLAKVIAVAPRRGDAARALAGVLRTARVHGVTTNRDLLVASLTHADFLAGRADTAFYQDNPPDQLLLGQGLDPALGAVIAAVADAAYGRVGQARSGFRNVPVGYRTRTYAVGERSIDVHYRFGRDGLELGALPAGIDGLLLIDDGPDAVTLDVDGVQRTWRVARFGEGDDARVAIDGPDGSITLRRVPRFVDPSSQAPAGALTAPMPGSVVRVAVSMGDRVGAGDPLMWLEAMKMEQPVRAPAAGIVTQLRVAVGDQVEQGVTLVVLADLHDASPAAD
jgi:hypothetical protein